MSDVSARVSDISAAEQRTLYVLMSVQGQIFDANFTGTFKGL